MPESSEHPASCMVRPSCEGLCHDREKFPCLDSVNSFNMSYMIISQGWNCHIRQQVGARQSVLKSCDLVQAYLRLLLHQDPEKSGPVIHSSKMVPTSHLTMSSAVQNGIISSRQHVSTTSSQSTNSDKVLFLRNESFLRASSSMHPSHIVFSSAGQHIEHCYTVTTADGTNS